MEERASPCRSRSTYLDAESPEDSEPSCEEIEMQSTLSLEPLGVNDVAELLQQQFAIISGGKSKEGCPIITFPDNNNFNIITDIEYQRLMLYLTSVPSLQDADLGFHLIIDRRKDRWNSVKSVLFKISVFFPGLIHVVYVLRPESFLQKAWSEVSNKLFKDEFKFRMVVLSSAEELQDYISSSQLTMDLNGTLEYSHHDWIQQRIQVEKFSDITHQVSNDLDEFTKKIEETELPNNVESTQQLLNSQTVIYSDLKEKILLAAKHGENLLCTIKEKSFNLQLGEETNSNLDTTVGNVFAVERLLVQLEETEKTFDNFWQKHSTRLRYCLELRRFEQDFRELQVNFDSHLKTVTDMTEVGESVVRVESLIKDTLTFEKLCLVDIERAEEVISSGQHLIQIKNSCPLECVEPKCTELQRMRKLLIDILQKHKDSLNKCRELMEEIEQANKWCAIGIDLLASQKIEDCSNSKELAERFLAEIQQFLKSYNEFAAKDIKETFEETVTPESKALLSQVLQRIEDVTVMCNKRVASLNKLLVKPKKPVQSVLPEPAVPRQPQGGAPHPNKALLKKAYTFPKMDSSIDHEEDSEVHPTSEQLSPETIEVNRIKTGHVLSELLETERVYVSELLSIITGYKQEAQSDSMQHLLPSGVVDKFKVIFGNLEELYKFHCDVFLKDMENCITSTDLVALCFVQKRDTFFRLYSFYCQNISRSEQVREDSTDLNAFFQCCQRKLGHKLPLGAYLLKPVQRITKYQLLLKDLLKYSDQSKCCKELQQALDCMLVVVKCVNDSMHQISVTGFGSLDLSEQGELLLQGSFSVWVGNKRDLMMRLKPMRRHLFLYQEALLICKPIVKSASQNKATYQFKEHLKMSQIGLTESVKGDARKFEIWLQGRQEVHTIQAANLEQKQTWVNEIKRVLFNQLQELKGEKIKQYSALAHKPLRQTTSWENKQENEKTPAINQSNRTMSCDAADTVTLKELETLILSNYEINKYIEESMTPDYIQNIMTIAQQPPLKKPSRSQKKHMYLDLSTTDRSSWDSFCSDGSTTDEEEQTSAAVPRGRYVTVTDYRAMGKSEVNIKQGDIVELLKVGCAGWWFVKVLDSSVEGWAPAAYLQATS